MNLFFILLFQLHFPNAQPPRIPNCYAEFQGTSEYYRTEYFSKKRLSNEWTLKCEGKQKTFGIKDYVETRFKDSAGETFIDLSVSLVKSVQFSCCYLEEFKAHAVRNFGSKWETPLEQYDIDSVIIYQLSASSLMKHMSGPSLVFFTAPNLMARMSVSKKMARDLTELEESALLRNARHFLTLYIQSIKTCN